MYYTTQFFDSPQNKHFLCRKNRSPYPASRAQAQKRLAIMGNLSMRAPILARHLIYSCVKGVWQSTVSKRAGFRDVNQLQLQFLYPERFYLVILRNGEGSCRSNNKRFNYLYDVGLGPASTKNSIPILHVEQAGLFPTTRSLRPLPCNPVCESRACPPCIFLPFNICHST